MNDGKQMLKRDIGLFSATAICVGQMIGSGIYMAPQGLAELANPKAAIIAMVITGIGSLLLAWSFSKMSEENPLSGSAIVNTKDAFGDLPAFMVGWSYWCGCWIANGAIILGGLNYLSYFFPILATANFAKYGITILTLWFFTIVNMRGVKKAGIMNLIITIVKLLPLILFIVIAVAHFDSANLETVSSPEAGGMGALPLAIAYALWSFLGFEGACINAAEMKNRKIIKKATMLGTGIVIVIYLLLIILAAGNMSQGKLMDSSSPLADILYEATGGYWTGGFIAIAVFISSFGCVGAWILSSARIAYSLGEYDLFPGSMAKINLKTKTPNVALVVNGILMTIIMLIAFFTKEGNLYNFLALLSVMSFLVFYVFGAASEIMLSCRKNHPANPLSFIKKSVISLLAFVYSVYAIYGSGADYVMWGFILILVGFPFFIYARSKQ